MEDLIVKENLKGKKLTKISTYFKRVGEKETMNGTYFFEDGTSKEGCSYNNNYLSGTINFSNDKDHIPIAEFIEGLKGVNWASQVASSIDNFEGKGSSIDYDIEDFESFEEGDSDGCDYDANKDPTTINIYFENKEIQFDLNYHNLYELKGAKYTKDDIIKLVKHFEK
tara:strand:- start:220 stop:723 length:504 start_codon:yes stop_codon:yes gene_type:complete